MTAARKKVDFDYEIIKSSNRNTADIVIERDGRVLVRAPSRVSTEKIEEIVDRKLYWIYKNLAEWRELNARRVTREYKNGEGFLYLGRSYRLTLAVGQTEQLLLKNGRFFLRRPLASKDNLTEAQEAFRRYYTAQCQTKISERASYFAPKIGVCPKKLQVKELGTRWASCSPSGNMAFHWKCMMAPPKIIDYIVVHELCHFLHLDHTEAFWNEVDKILPDYLERKEWLRTYGVSLDI